MQKKHITVIIVSLVVIAATIAISACASSALAGTKSPLEAQVGTAAAATVVQHMIETQVAIQSGALAMQPAAQAQPTATAAPTATAIPPTAVPPTAEPPTAVPPTATPLPNPASAAAVASGIRIVADQNTNCRSGPGTGYTIKTVFAKGTESTVQGRNDGKNWWYIVNPANSGDTCWVWEGSTTVFGDTSTIAVIAAPAISAPKYSNWYGDGYYTCGQKIFCNGYYYNDNYCDYPYTYWGNCPNNNWWNNCSPFVNCKCKPVCKNPCKKSNCPPVTPINYKKYCQNYPKCCKADGNILWLGD